VRAAGDETAAAHAALAQEVVTAAAASAPASRIEKLEARLQTMADRSAAAWDMMRLLSAATAVGGGGVSQEPSDARASCPVCNP